MRELLLDPQLADLACRAAMLPHRSDAPISADAIHGAAARCNGFQHSTHGTMLVLVVRHRYDRARSQRRIRHKVESSVP